MAARWGARAWGLVAGVLAWLVQAAAEGTCSTAGAHGCEQRAHLWPRARGHTEHYGVTNLTGPFELSQPWYNWFPGKTRFRNLILCGPLIDDQKNLYITSATSIYKMSPDGRLIWEFVPPFDATIHDCPSLSPGRELFGTALSGHIYALNIDTGTLIWAQQYGQGSGDTAYVENYNGVVIFEQDPDNGRAIAVKASDGSKLWEFRPDCRLWNLMAVFPGDDTVLFQDHDARTYRLGLHNGTLLWKKGGGHQIHQTWTDGGAMIGPTGLVYAVSSKGLSAFHHPTVGGGVHAYRIDTGALVWQHHLLRPVFTWPTVGKLPGREGYSVIVGTGSNAFFAWKATLKGYIEGLGDNPWTMIVLVSLTLVQFFYGEFSQSGCRWFSLRLIIASAFLLMGPVVLTIMYAHGLGPLLVTTFEADIYAYDADTGEQQWVYHLPSWPYVSAAGDSEGFFERTMYFPQRTMCLPAAYNAPTIDGRGTVWIGYHSGLLYGLRDENLDGVVEEDEVVKFDTQAAFLHSGPAFAPGLMAVTNCDSLWVWKT